MERFWDLRGKNDPPNPVSRKWEPGGRWAQEEVETIDTELKDKLPREQPVASGQKRRWETVSSQFLAMMALQLGTHMAKDGGWSRIQQPADMIELFSKDAPVSWQFRQLEDGPLSLMMAALVTL